MRKLVALIPLLCLSLLGLTNHLVGGDLTYVYNGGNSYTFTLTIYRDCNCPPPCANLDGSINYSIFRGTTLTHPGPFNNKTANIVGPTQVPISTQGICLATIPNVCVEKGVYTFTEILPPSPQGYTVAYQRCCRNQTIQNIFDPSTEGMTLSVNIPPTGATNNSATWNNFPPIIICANNPFEFNHSATDIDGDSLVYSICDPLDGGNATSTVGGGGPVPNFTSAPPYTTIPFLAPYTSNNPIGGSPFLNIDSVGIMRANPTMVGQFVVGVCVAEYRNGVLINTIRRDFQFNITTCDITLARVNHSQVGPNGELLVFDCDDFDVLFQNTSLGADSYLWDFGDSLSTTDTSSLNNPTYLYPDSGIYCVTLIADPGKVCADTALIKLHLFPGLTPDFDSAVTDCSNIPIQFTDLSVLPTFDMIDSWLWDFGDGDTSNSQNPTHLFPLDGGLFDVTLFLFTDKGCLDSVTKKVLIHPTPNISWTTSLPCPNEVITFTNTSVIANGTITNYQWNFGDPASGGNNIAITPNATHIYTTPGIYNVSLTATSNLGCSETVIVPITIYPEVIANAGVDTFVCIGYPIMLRASGGNVYNWMPSAGLNSSIIDTPFASPTVATTYIVQVQDPNGCTDFDTVFVDVKPTPTVDAGNDTSICFGSTIQLQAKGGIAYEWDNTPSIDNWFIADPLATPSGTLTYFINITDSNGCVGRDSIRITVNPPLRLSVSPDAYICQFDSIELLATGGLFYKWIPNFGLSNDSIANPKASPDYTTTYVVEISDDCFTGYDTVTITVDEAPYVYTNDDQTIKAGESIELLGGGGTTFEWTIDPTLNYTGIRTPLATPLDTTTYIFTAFSANGCTNTDSVTVFVTFGYELLLPTAFTPNADGLNDRVKLLHYGIKQIDQFQIYNRWGQMVFETTNIDDGWDGFFENNKQPVGGYAYVVRAQTYLNEAVEIKGQITLLR